MTLSNNTSIKWEVVLWLLGAAVSWGILYQRVDGIDGKLQEQGRDIAEIRSYLMRAPNASVASSADKSP